MVQNPNIGFKDIFIYTVKYISVSEHQKVQINFLRCDKNYFPLLNIPEEYRTEIKFC